MVQEIVTAAYQGKSISLPLETPELPVRVLVERIAEHFGLVNVKLVVKGAKFLIRDSEQSCGAAGLREGCKVMVLGSKEADVQKILNSRDLPGMAGFDHELRTIAARRKRQKDATVQLPLGPYTFGTYEAWNQPGLTPPPSEATKLLHRLAADPGIVDVMKQNSWRVGKLSEMPPEGKEGISPVCVLGVNINAGQEISLRLRTDDLQGFRRYLSIRDTLCHELAHMVYGEHDNKFKTLNSQIRNHVERLTQSAGAKLFETAAGWDLEAPALPQDVMSASAGSSGRTLRQLAEESGIKIEALGHRDRQTEAKEAAAEKLSALPSELAEPNHSAPEKERPTEAPQQQQNRGHVPASHLSSIEHNTTTTQQQRLQKGNAGSDAVMLETQPSDQAAVASSREAEESEKQDSESEPQPAASERTTTDASAEDKEVARGSGSAPQEDIAMLIDRGDEDPAAVPTHGQDDGSAAYLANALEAVDTILQSAEQHAAVLGLTTLLTILKNALEHPRDPKFRRIKLQNPAFFQRAGRLSGSLDVLKTAGFVLSGENGEQILKLEREDPGLLWLTLSACEQGLQRLAVH